MAVWAYMVVFQFQLGHGVSAVGTASMIRTLSTREF